jgi:thiamine pyrophosphokinase
VVIGDLDSIKPAVREYFTSLPTPTEIVHVSDQESTDFGKAITWIREHHPGDDIVAMGGLEGRVDQAMSQLHYLYRFQEDIAYSLGRLFLVSEQSLTFLLKKGKHRISLTRDESFPFGEHVGIIPVKEPSRITLRGFVWDVTDWETEFGGMISTSNKLPLDVSFVEVETTTDVLFTVELDMDESIV